jgi:soluble lytic murein transglycosylase-like protein
VKALSLILLSLSLLASDNDRKLSESIARMQVAIEKQRASVLRQAGGAPANSFFTLPWSDAPSALAGEPVVEADCDPIPADQLRRLVAEAAVKEGINPSLIQAVIRRESGGRPCAVSPRGAQGLMQLMPPTQSDLGVRDPFDPAENINAGARYLKQLLTRYKTDLRLALAAYNAGPQRVEPGGQVPAIPETQAYVTAILADLKGSEDGPATQ